jgi:hypothetical protein
MIMNNTLAASAANIATIVIGVAFFAVTAVGIAQPVHAAPVNSTVTTIAAR